MPNISYLRELSLIKSGYTPSEAKSIVDNENILKFQSQSEETKNAYRNYYAGLFTNSGSSVKGVSITPYSVKASSLGLSSRQPNAFIGGDITAPTTVDDYISRGVGLRPLPAPVRQNTNLGTGIDITTNAPVQGFKPLPVPEIKRPQAPQAPQVSQPTQVAQDTVPQLQPLNITPPKNTPIEEIQAPVVAKPLKPISLSANFLLPTREQALKNIPGIKQSQLNFYTNISPKEKAEEIGIINNLRGQVKPNIKEPVIKPILNESLSGLLNPTKPIKERFLDGQNAIKFLDEEQKLPFGKDQTKAINYIKAIMSNLQTDKSTNDLYNMADKISDSEEDFKTDYFQNIFEKQDPKLMGPPSITRHNSLLGPRIPKILGKSEYDIFMELAAPDIYSFDSEDPSKIKLNDKGIALQAVLKSKSEREALSVLAPEQYTWAQNYIKELIGKLQTAVEEKPIKAQTELEKEYTKEIPVPPRLTYLSTVAETNPNLLSSTEKKEYNFLVDQYNKQIDDKRGRIEFLQKELDKRRLFFSTLEGDLDIYSPVKNHWVSKIAKETLEIYKTKQSAYDQLYYGNFKDLGIVSKDKDLIFGGESILRTAGKVASGLENWWDRTISNPLASEALKDAYLSKDVSDREYRELLKDYLQTDDYPIFDKVASEQAGRLVGAGEFIYFKKKGKLLGFLPVPAIGVGTGFSYEGPGIVLDMIPSLLVTAGVGTVVGGSIKTYARYSKAQTFKKLAEAEKIADVGTRAKQVAELLTTNARTQRILKAAEVKNWQGAYRSFAQSSIAAQGTWAGKQAAKLLYNSTPTMIGIGATTYHKIYRQTLKQYYNEGVENAEEKAATTAKLLTAVEMITEGLNPDINYFFPKGTLDPESFFGKLANYFGGKKIQSVQDYRRIISMLDINPKSADVFARMLYWTKNGLDKGATFTKVMAKTGMNFNEGLEEVLASLGGHAVELMQFPVTGIQPEELSAETILNDFVGGMFLTGPMGIMQLGNYFQEEKLQRAYRMAINPEVHKSKINNLLANGKISQDQAVKALLQIDNLNKVFQDSTFDNLVNEATFLDDKEAQYQYFKDKVNKEGLNKFMETEEFANLSEEEKEKVIRNAEEISKDIQSFKRRANAFSNLPKEEKEARLKKIADKNLKIVSKGSLYEMEIALESQRREKAIARINARPVFEKIKGPMEYMENELIRMIDERKAVIKNAKDNDELNPLFEDVYLPDESAPKAGISVESTSDVLTMLMQATINPDTKNILKDLRKNLVMRQVKDEALNKITQEYLNEVKVDRVEDLSGPQTKELHSLQESASATYQSIEEQMDALYEGILEKFAPSVQANVVSRESIEAQLIEALLDLEYIESIELTPEQQINLRAFSELLDSTAEERRQFVQDIMEAENEAKRKEVRENLLAEQKRAREVAPQEVIEEEGIPVIEDESLPEVIPNVEFDFERTKNLTEFDSKIKSAVDVYVGSKDSRKVAGKRTVLVNYIVTAPTKEQAIERAMFVLSLTNQANEQTQKLITELFNNPINFFGELSSISALNSLGKIGEALAKKEAQIKTFQTAEIVEETPIVIEETPVAPVEQPETEIQTTTPVIPITNGSYGISYSNIHLLDPSSIDHKYAVRAKKIVTTISRNLYDYQIRIVDLFTYLRETYGEQLITGKENSIQSFYEEAQAIEQIADDKERQQAQRQLKAKVDSFFGNYLQGVLSPSALNYHVSEIFLGSENGLKYPKTTQKSGYEDTNIIFGVAVRDGEIAKFNEEGELSETGAVMALTIARDETRPEMLESAIPGNILRQSVVDNKSININVPILGIHDHTQSQDLSVGMSLDLMKASEFVSESQKTLASLSVQQPPSTEPSDIKAKKADIERRRQEELNKGALPNVPDYVKEEIDRNVKAYTSLLQKVRELAYQNKTKSEIAKELNVDKEIINSLRTYLQIPSMDSKTEFQEWKNKIDKINAKYDAELAALESQTKPSVEPTEPTVEIIEDKEQNEVDRLIKERDEKLAAIEDKPVPDENKTELDKLVEEKNQQQKEFEAEISEKEREVDVILSDLDKATKEHNDLADQILVDEPLSDKEKQVANSEKDSSDSTDQYIKKSFRQYLKGLYNGGLIDFFKKVKDKLRKALLTLNLIGIMIAQTTGNYSFEQYVRMAENYSERHLKVKPDTNLQTITIKSVSKKLEDNTGTNEIPYKGGYATNQIINLDENKFEARNRNDKTPVENAVGITTNLFKPFQEVNKFKGELPRKDEETRKNPPVIAFNKNTGKVKAGNLKEFNTDWLVSETFTIPLNFKLDSSGKLKTVPHAQAMRNVPVTTVDGKEVPFPIGLNTKQKLIDPTKHNTFGVLEGGKVIMVVGDYQVQVNGGFADIYEAWKKLKEKNPNKEITAYLLDNGSYNLPILKKDGIVTKDDFAKHIGRNRDGGTSLVLKQKTTQKDTNYPYGYQKIETNNFRKDRIGNKVENNPEVIVLHHTGEYENGEQSVINEFTSPGGNSSHYLIGKDGKIYQFNDPSYVLFHAGESIFNGKEDLNSSSIGIEIQGDSKIQDFTKEQYQSLVTLVYQLAKNYGIPIENIIDHKTIRDNYLKAHPEDKVTKEKEDLNHFVMKNIVTELKKGYPKIAKAQKEQHDTTKEEDTEIPLSTPLELLAGLQGLDLAIRAYRRKKSKQVENKEPDPIPEVKISQRLIDNPNKQIVLTKIQDLKESLQQHQKALEKLKKESAINKNDIEIYQSQIESLVKKAEDIIAKNKRNESKRNKIRTEYANKIKKALALKTQTEPSVEPTPQAPSDGVEQDVRTANDFANENEFYRVIVGDESFNDILESGLVRTNAKNKGGQSLADKLARRPTLWPSFSKGRAAMNYANSNENHYIIVSEDQSIQPSTKGRHGMGTTMFPTDANGNPMESISGDKVKVYKHLGNGKYELVYANGKAIEQSTNATLQAAPFTPSEPAKKIIAATNQEFSIAAIENVIRDTNAVPTPEGYLVNGKLYVSQSNYNKTSDGVTPQEDVDKAAFAVGDFVDLLGKDILLGIENVSKAEYEQRVIEKQNLTGNFTVPDALFYGLKSSFRAWKNVIESNGGKIFAQDMVLHSEFKSPNTSIKEGTTYYGVAGRPDIVIVDKKGQVHIVDMKNIKFGSEKGSRQYETDRRDVFAPITSNKQKRKDYWQTQQNTYAMMASGLLPEISSINILGIQSAYTTKDTGIEVTNLDIINFEDIANNSTIPLVGKLSLTAIQNRQKIASEFVARNPLTFVENTSNVPQSERPLCS